VTNVLLDRNGAIQAHHDVSIIDFASIAKEQRNEQQSTLFNLIEDAGDRARFQQALKDLAGGKADTRTLQVSIQGKRHIAGIAYLPDIKWFMVSLTHPESAQNRGYFAAVIVIRILGLALTLLIVGIMFDRMVLRRLASLDAAARELAAGNYAAKPPQRGRDEIGRLGRTLEAMARRVQTHTADLEQQVTERTEVLERMAYADFLTGLLNRRGIIDRIEMERNRLGRSNGKIGVIVLDVDHFKKVNDDHGHYFGDRALVHVANTIRGVMRSYDVCARWGGEEFLVIAPGIADAATLVATAEKLRQGIARSPVSQDGTEVRLAVSIGCHLADPAESIDRMIKAADDALYSAKQTGRNRVVMSAPAAS
jgi:diguanylate cyclase (GGDEF)-like protein